MKTLMFEETSEPKKRLSARYDLAIILVSVIVLYIVAFQFDIFGALVGLVLELKHLKLGAVFVTFIGLNFVLSALLLYHRRQLIREFDNSRNAARHLAQERILLRTVIDHLPDYIFVKNRAGQFMLTNIAHAKAVRSTPEQLIGKRASEVFPSDLAAQFDADDEQIMLSNRPLINAERMTVNQFNEIRSVLTTKIPLSDSSGRIIGLVGVSRDITDRKMKEQQELDLAQERERIRMMTLFTRDAAHDFRTPLATINTSVYLMVRSNDPERQRHYAQNIEHSIARLSKLLDGLTFMTLLDSSHALDTELIDLNQLLRSVVATAPSIAKHPGLRVEVDLDECLPLLPGAAEELHDAFINLIDNAVQFTPDGGCITLQTRPHGDEVQILVKDTGIGIDSDDLPHVFDRFFRTDRARSSETGGIGLGLSITRKIIELHRGRIEADSTEGKGSTFRVYLPMANAQVLDGYSDATRPSRR